MKLRVLCERWFSTALLPLVHPLSHCLCKGCAGVHVMAKLKWAGHDFTQGTHECLLLPQKTCTGLENECTSCNCTCLLCCPFFLFTIKLQLLSTFNKKVPVCFCTMTVFMPKNIIMSNKSQRFERFEHYYWFPCFLQTQLICWNVAITWA